MCAQKKTGGVFGALPNYHSHTDRLTKLGKIRYEKLYLWSVVLGGSTAQESPCFEVKRNRLTY